MKIKNKEYRHNLMLKIFSVLFAFLIWSYVKAEVDPIQDKSFRDVEVRFENIQQLKDNDMVIIPVNEPKITVTLSGKLSNMTNVVKEGIIAKANLQDYGQGEHAVPVTVSYIDSGVIVSEYDPRTISLIIDKKITEEMTVNIIVEGKPENSYVLGRVKEQEKVNVSGPKTYIDKISRLEAVVTAQDLNRSTVSSAKVYALDNDEEIIEGVTIEPSNIDVEIPIFKTETVPVKLNLRGPFPEGLNQNNFTITPNSVTIRGNSAVIDRIQEISTEPIFIEDIMEGDRNVKLTIPEGVTLVDPAIEYFVRKIETSS